MKKAPALAFIIALACAASRPLAAAPHGAGFYDTSEYMIGKVVVSIVFPESSGGSETWSSGRKASVVSEVQAAMNWWKVKDARAKLSFVYISTTVATSYEPITCNAAGGGTCEEADWVTEVMGNMGYTEADYFDRVYHYNNDIRAANNADWAFTVFVADSYNDIDGMFPDGYFAYAYVGGPFQVMTYDNENYGISDMDSVCAHETGHIFYALDEYDAPCLTTDRAGYLNATNDNCVVSPVTDDACIMRGQTAPYETNSICAATRRMIGWRDTGATGIFDITRLPPTTVLGPYSPDPTSDNTPTYYGIAHSTSAYTNSNPYNEDTSHYYYTAQRNDISVLKIAGAEYNINGEAWQAASSRDGAFDATIDSFTFTPAAQADAAYTFRARAYDDYGNYDGSPPSDALTINTAIPDDILYVYDGTGADIDYRSNTESLSANWGASDYPGGVTYEYAIGTTPEGTEISGWTSTGVERSVTRSGLTLVDGTLYYFGVRAVGAGPVYSGVSVSDGVRVDITTPTARIEISPASLPAKTGALSVKLVVTETNGFAQTPTLSFTTSDGYHKSLSLSYLVSSTWTATPFIESFYSTGTASFSFYAEDLAGNSGAVITSGGNFEINSAVSGVAGGIVANSDRSAVTVPAGAYSGDLVIRIATVPVSRTSFADASASASSALTASDLVREFTARTPSGLSVNLFDPPLTLKLCYPDANNDGRIDGDYIEETVAGLYRLDEALSRWTPVAGAVRDASANCISAAASHFSVYAIRVRNASQSGMGSIKAYPNPCYFDQSPSLTISGIPSSAENPKIYIYNTAGELVKVLVTGDGINKDDNNTAVWNGRNKSGEKVASGLYIYLATTDNYGKGTGKFYVFW